MCCVFALILLRNSTSFEVEILLEAGFIGWPRYLYPKSDFSLFLKFMISQIEQFF